MMWKSPWLKSVFCAGFLLWGAAALADMPAQNFYWAKLDAIAEAAKAFPPAEVAAFESKLKEAVNEEGWQRKDLDPSFKSVRESFMDAFENLVKLYVERGEIDKANGFLKAVSDGGWIQGYQRARDGGDFVTALEVVAGDDGMYYLRLRQSPLPPGSWSGVTFNYSLEIPVKKSAPGGKLQAGAQEARPLPSSGTAPVSGAASQALYRAPDDLELSLAPHTGAAPPAGEVLLAARIKALIGRPADVKVRFLCSPDLAIEPREASFPALDMDEEDVLLVKVRAGKATASGSSWVKMLVTYKPDAVAISAVVRAAVNVYPNPQLRERLLKEIAERKEPVQRASGYPFPKPPFDVGKQKN